MKTIGIFGMGYIGSILAKYLNLIPNNKIIYFNRSERKLIKIQFENQLTEVPIELSSDIDITLDWLIVCIKEYHYKVAIPQIKKLVSTTTKVAVFRNGLNLSTALNGVVAPENILETIIDCPTQLNKKGEYLQFKKPRIILPSIALSDDFITLLRAQDIDFFKSEKFELDQWRKLIESSSMGSIQVITNQTCSVFKDPYFLNQYSLLITEAISVANSEGIEIDVNLTDTLIKKLMEYSDAKGSSMLTDKRSGKKLELGAKIGAILNIGLKNEIDIPTTQSVYNTLI